MLLSPDESALLSFQETVCSVVFSALTDPSVQLQLVGIRALTVLGSLQGWCLTSPGEAEGRHCAALGAVVSCLCCMWMHRRSGSTCYSVCELQEHLIYLACLCWAPCIFGVCVMLHC